MRLCIEREREESEKMRGEEWERSGVDIGVMNRRRTAVVLVPWRERGGGGCLEDKKMDCGLGAKGGSVVEVGWVSRVKRG